VGIWKTSSERKLRFFRSVASRVSGEKPSSLSEISWSSVTSGRVVARVPRRNVKEFWLTILSEAERSQIQLAEPEGRVLDLQ